MAAAPAATSWSAESSSPVSGEGEATIGERSSTPS